MANHPNRTARHHLARILTIADGMQAEIAADKFDQSEIAILTDRPDLIDTSGSRWRLTPDGRDIVRADRHPPIEPTPPGQEIDANRIYWLVRKVINADSDWMRDAADAGGLDVSMSRVNGWGKHPGDRKHVKMTMAELERVLIGALIITDDDD